MDLSLLTSFQQVGDKMTERVERISTLPDIEVGVGENTAANMKPQYLKPRRIICLTAFIMFLFFLVFIIEAVSGFFLKISENDEFIARLVEVFRKNCTQNKNVLTVENPEMEK